MQENLLHSYWSMKGLILVILCGFFLVFSWFNGTVIGYWKHLPSLFLDLLLPFCFLSVQGNLCTIHYDSDLFYGIYNARTWTLSNIKGKTFNQSFSNSFFWIGTNHDFSGIAVRMRQTFFIVFLDEFSTCLMLQESHSQKSATFTVTSVTDVLTMQRHINLCNKYLENWLGD